MITELIVKFTKFQVRVEKVDAKSGLSIAWDREGCPLYGVAGCPLFRVALYSIVPFLMFTARIFFRGQHIQLLMLEHNYWERRESYFQIISIIDALKRIFGEVYGNKSRILGRWARSTPKSCMPMHAHIHSSDTHDCNCTSEILGCGPARASVARPLIKYRDSPASLMVWMHVQLDIAIAAWRLTGL